MLINIQMFVGRFHPLIVHLPIGFLLLAVLFALLSRIKKYKALRIAVPISLLAGGFTAALACITGFTLSLTGDYDEDTLSSHMWAGIGTTIFSFVAYLAIVKKIPYAFLQTPKAIIATFIILLLVISITGHLGGTLTHGSNYLTTAVLFDNQKKKKKVGDINEAYVFADLVHPILEDKCGSCHNNSKKKGKLSLERYEDIENGGKHGKVIKSGDPAASELIKRVSLDPGHKKFMPSDGKTPLSPDEKAILKWWIEKCAGNKDKKIADLNAPAEIKKQVAAYLGMKTDDVSEHYPITNIQAPSIRKEVVDNLRQTGYVIKYLNFKPGLLDVTLTAKNNSGNVSDKIKALLQVKDNIIWLNISGNDVTDDEMLIVNQFKNLEHLKLGKNPITDNGIEKLKGLSNLKSLNLYETKITKDCLPFLLTLSSLQTAYVWKTGINQKDSLSYASTIKLINGK